MTNITLEELLKLKDKTIKRHAFGILKRLIKQQDKLIEKMKK